MSKEIESLDDLTPDDHNANRGTQVGMWALEKSVEQVGFGRPILVDRNGKVIAGNKTLETAIDRGYDSIQVVRSDGRDVVVHQRMDLDLDHDEANRARQMAIADNRVAERNLEWDPIELAAARQIGVDLKHLFGDHELDRMLKDLEPPKEAPAAKTDRAEELREKWQTERGQVWEIGAHRLVCGDCTSQSDLDELMGGKKAQMIFTDPPYGVDYTGGMKIRERLVADSIGTDIYSRALPMLSKAVDENAALYLWYADGHAAAAAAAAAAAGYEIVAQIIWAKNHAQFVTSAHYKGKHEPCLYGHKRGKSARWNGPKNKVTLWECDRSPSNDYHPTQKPVPIAERAIRNSTAKRDIVLDGFLGGGTTMVAAELLGRACYGCEIEPRYVAVALERMADMGLEPVLKETYEV